MLYVDLLILLGCGVSLSLWAYAFPYPSLLIRPFLSPRLRWPEARIRKWLRDGGFDKSYLRYFYRDPEREVPVESGLIAPADGLVTSLDVRDGTRYLVIALSFWDMHIQRSPLDGVVKTIEDLGADYMDGEGRNFAFLQEKTAPVQKRITLNVGSDVIAVRLITSLAARRLEAWVAPGDEVERGQRIGKILLGSTVVLELPEAWPVLVGRGDRVWAGETLVAQVGVEA